MIITPYDSVDQLQFGKSDVADCMNRFGDPEQVRTSRSGHVQYVYSDFIARFDGIKGTFREFTLLPKCSAVIGTIPVTWDRAFLLSLCEVDGFPVESVGFVILPRLGVAVTGIHDDDPAQLAVGAFEFGIWDEPLKRAKPFDMTTLS